MDWNSNLKATAPFVSSRPETSFSFLYNYNYEQFPADIMKQAAMMPAFSDSGGSSMGIANNNNGHDPKKKRLSNEQLEMLENSFQDEVKLDPDRKMKLAKELGLHPRQIAVWFQNRRARWKSKQLERLYDALKQEYDAVSRDKLKLQQEVMALRSILNKEQTVGKNQISTGYTEISVESTSIPSTSDQNPRHRQYDPTATNDPQQIADQCNATANNNYGIFHVDCDDYNNGGNNNTVLMMPPYWGPPSCP